MAQRINHRRFIAFLSERFPEVAAGIDDIARGLLHPEMATLARATQAAIDTGDETTLRHHFAFIGEVLACADPDVENAVYVSYLENLRFDDDKAKAASAFALLPPQLRLALAELDGPSSPRPRATSS